MKVALYMRISKEEAGNGGESSSIEGQRLLLREFVQKHSELARGSIIEVVDDGYTGTNFDRPGIRALLKMAERREVDCIAVKDFSRFGRNYVEVGNYLEQVFPLLRIRFFSVNDGFDSSYRGGAAGAVDVGFRNIIAETYSRELSLKVKSVRKIKAEQGKFVSAFAPYGYRKADGEKDRLVIDRECAPVVQKIYRLYMDGWTQTEIVKRLNKEAVPSPGAVREERGEQVCRKQCAENNRWSGAAVSRILRDKRYTGTAVYGKTRPESIRSRHDTAVLEEEWIVVPNAHEPIVSLEEYEFVQARRKSRKLALSKQPNM